MSEAIAIPPLAVAGTDLALESQATIGSGVTLTLEAPGSRWSLRARTADALAAVIGRAVPMRIGETRDGLACLGPDEWLADLPAGTGLPDGAGQPVSVVDIASRAVVIRVEGARGRVSWPQAVRSIWSALRWAGPRAQSMKPWK